MRSGLTFRTENKNRTTMGLPKINPVLFIIVILIVVFLSGIYLHLAWQSYQKNAESEALMLAQSLKATFHPEEILELTASAEDVGKEDYELMKKSLIRLTLTTNPIHFAYLMAERNGEIVFLVDSEPTDSEEYSPPGQVYYEADEVLWNVFRSGESVMTKPTSDRWGQWISGLVPIQHPTTGEIIAVFGIDYSTEQWYADLQRRMIPDLIILLCLLVLAFAWFRSWAQKYALNQLSQKTAFDEALYHSVFDQSPIGIAIMKDGKVVHHSNFGDVNVNPTFETILGWSRSELENKTWIEITHPEDLQEDLEKFAQFKAGELPGYSMEKRFLKPDGSSVWTKMFISPLQDSMNETSMHICIIEDITTKREALESLRESERSKSVLISNLPGMAYRCKYDRDWTMEFVSGGCRALTGYAPESLIQNQEVSYNDLISPDYRELLWEEWQRVIAQKRPFNYEYEITTASGEHKWVLEMGEAVYDEQGQVEALEGIIFDVTDREEIAKANEFLAYHDFLTGLFNRRFLAEEFERRSNTKKFPIALLLGDIDNFKHLNDTLGYVAGDKVLKEIADKLQKLVRPEDLLARIGGDEFAIVVSGMKETEVRQYLEMLNREFDQGKELESSRGTTVSWGYGIQTDAQESFDQIRERAESLVNNRKFYNQKSMRSKMVDVIMETLFVKSEREKRHSERVGRLCEGIARKMHLSKSDIDKVRVAGFLHDIGKIGIDEAILNKPGKLNQEEWEIMKLHPSKSAEILLKNKEYNDIAEIVLFHHERMDGRGYPGGFSGNEIPIMSRIVAVCDAYDAMTEQRMYRKPMSKEEAIAELRRCSGTQFDSEIVELFVSQLLEDTKSFE